MMLKKEFDIVSLEELVRHISGGIRSEDRLLALTFDDGPSHTQRRLFRSWSPTASLPPVF